MGEWLKYPIEKSKRKFRIISKMLSKYLPTYEGVFFCRDSSPSAASRMDLRIRKKLAAQ
jgi:hypothetical protein